VLFDFHSHFYARERKEHRTFQAILQTVPDLDVRLLEGSEEDIKHIADLVRIYNAVDDTLVLR
jgi:hypothetical protein